MTRDGGDWAVLELREDLAVLQTVSSIYSISLSIAGRLVLLELTVASAPPKLPKLMLLLLPCRLDGGRPPLGGG